MARRGGKGPRKPRGLKLSLEERQKRKIRADHKRLIRTAMRNMGFVRAAEVAGINLRFGEQGGELDDVFVYENLVVLVEYTAAQSSDVTGHIKGKALAIKAVAADPKAALAYLREKVPAFDERLGDTYHPDRYVLRWMYCSRYIFDTNIKKVVPELVYFDYPYARYFAATSSVIKLSAIDELLHFLGVTPTHIARGGAFPGKYPSDSYDGLILPEASSGFDPGFKVVSFYADAAALMKRAFVLRKDGWRGSSSAYQRMLIGSKIEAIRRKLKSNERVFVNNIIATLPPDVEPEKRGGRAVDIRGISSTEQVTIRLPARPNSIGLIDGQHRLYSYYEETEDDPQIAKLRIQQNLLVTGIIFPEGLSAEAKERFEAELFLSINANQTNAPSALRQEIEVLLSPSSPTAIGRQVMQRLARTGPLVGHVEEFFWDKGKLKTSSIVSYGLGPLLKLGGDDSLFSLFEHPSKERISESSEALEAYLDFATSHINMFLSAVKLNVARERWTPDSRTKNRLIAVTYINAFLIALRLLIQSGRPVEFGYLKVSLKGLNEFEFKAYHSSQYSRMAEKIFDKHFK